MSLSVDPPPVSPLPVSPQPVSPPPASLVRRRSRRAKVLGVSLILGFIVALDIALGSLVTWLTKIDVEGIERAYRQSSPYYHHDLTPNIHQRGIWGHLIHEISTNSLGFKDETTRRVPMPAKGDRIVFIGDSFTEGLGFPYRRTFVGLVDAALRPEGYDVLNAGVLSYSPIIYWRKTRYLIEERGLKFNHLVVFIDISDIEDEARTYRLDDDGRVIFSDEWVVVDRLRREAREEIKANRPLRSRLVEFSLLLQTLDLLKDSALHRGQDGWPETIAELQTTDHVTVPRVSWTFDDDAYAQIGVEGLRRSSEHMDQLFELTKDHDIALYVAVYPWPGQVIRRDHPNRHTEHWKAWSEAHNVPFLDLTGAFVNERDPISILKEYYIEDDCHFNEAGHALVAERFLAFWRSLEGRRAPSMGDGW